MGFNPAFKGLTVFIHFMFHRKHLVRSEIEMGGSILEQVKQFNYLGCELRLDGEPDFDKN